MLGTFLFLILFFVFFLLRKSKAIFVLILFSLMNDLVVFSLGFSLPFHFFIALIYSPFLILNHSRITKNIIKIISPLYVEFAYLIILAIVFGFIIPWESNQDLFRSWSQKAQGKSIIQVVRLFAEFSLILLLLYWLISKKISISFILKSTIVLIIVTVVIAYFDVRLNGLIKEILFSDGRIIGDRYTGLNGEPRAFGRICALVLLFLIAFKKNISSKQLYLLGICFSILGLLLSLSASAFLMVSICLIIYVIFTKKIKYLIIGIPIFLVSIYFLNQNEFFREQTLVKMEIAFSETDDFVLEKVNSDEPEFFIRFEIFDRAALNFFYHNPTYLLTGTGPNLISIPSSKYLTDTNADLYEDRIDSAPHSFIVNLLSRSGLIGIFIWFVFFVTLFIQTAKLEIEKFAFFIAIFVANLMVITSLFFLYIAIIFYLISMYKASKNKKFNDKYNNTRFKW